MSKIVSQDFTGRVVLLTGAGSGIGKATALHLANLGASLSLTGRNLENLQKVEEEILKINGPKPLLIQADLTKEDDITNIVGKTIEHFGKLNVLINNAAVFVPGSIEETNLDQFDLIFRTNVRAVYQLVQLSIPYLEATKGNIINVSSMVGIRAFKGMLLPCLAKATLDHLSQCVALEVADKGIRVNSINPGTINTDIFGKAGLDNDAYLDRSAANTPLGRVGTVEEVAMTIAFMASDQANFMTGARISIDGGRAAACR